ncbi:hypothetical protein CRENBAI_010383, partial [Crenichthys baileyi]
MRIPDGNRTGEAPNGRMSPCWPPEAALIEADFIHDLQKKAGTTSHAFLHVRPGSKKPKVPLSYGLAGPAITPSPQLQRLAASPGQLLFSTVHAASEEDEGKRKRK